MPGVSELCEQSLLPANTVWRKLTRPVSGREGLPACVVPLCLAGRTGSGIGFVAIFLCFSGFLTIANLTTSPVLGQTASTGGLAGVALDPSGVVLPGASILLVNQETLEEESTISDEQGRFGFQFISSRKYELRAKNTAIPGIPESI